MPGEIADVSNLDSRGEILAPENRLRLFQLGNQLWHTDSAFKHVPAKASLLYQRSIAQTGGQTEFADLRAAWDALPEAKRKKLEGLKVFHSIFHSRAKIGMTNFTERERALLPGAEQVLVRTGGADGAGAALRCGAGEALCVDASASALAAAAARVL